MIDVKFNVDEQKVRVIQKSGKLLSGNIEQINCEFALSDEFNKVDVIRVLFDGEGRTLIDGMCFAPELNAGYCEIGVYGYVEEEGRTVLRIAPAPCTVYVEEGSYMSGEAESKQPPSTELEEYYQRIKNLIDNIDVNLTDSDIQNIATAVIDDRQEADNTTYSSSYIMQLIGAVNSLSFKIADSDETIEEMFTNPDTKCIYLVPNAVASDDDMDSFLEILMLEQNGEFKPEIIGSTQLGLSDYYKKSETYSKDELNAYGIKKIPPRILLNGSYHLPNAQSGQISLYFRDLNDSLINLEGTNGNYTLKIPYPKKTSDLVDDKVYAHQDMFEKFYPILQQSDFRFDSISDDDGFIGIGSDAAKIHNKTMYCFNNSITLRCNSGYEFAVISYNGRNSFHGTKIKEKSSKPFTVEPNTYFRFILYKSDSSEFESTDEVYNAIFFEKVEDINRTSKDQWRKLFDITIDEDVEEVIRTVDDNGNAFRLKKARLLIELPQNEIDYFSISIQDNGEYEDDSEYYPELSFSTTYRYFSGGGSSGKKADAIREEGIKQVDIDLKPYANATLTCYGCDIEAATSWGADTNMTTPVFNAISINQSYMDYFKIYDQAEHGVIPAGAKIILWGVDDDENI